MSNRTRGVVVGVSLLLLAGSSAPAQGSRDLVRNVRFLPADVQQSQSEPAIGLTLDREEYDPLDITGVAVVKVETGTVALSDTKVALEVVTAAGRVAHRETVAPLKDRLLDVTLNTAAIPLGNYVLRASLLDKKRATLAKAESPLRKKVRRAQIPPPERQRVPLRIWPVTDLDAKSPAARKWPIATGIPFPQGALMDARNVRLLGEDGVEVPCQVTVRSEWNRHGSVRWLGLDFQSDLKASGGTCFVEFGTQVSRGSPGVGIRVTEDASRIAVDAGRLRFIVRKDRFNLLDEVQLDGRFVSRQGKRDGFVLVDHEGSVYRASNDAAADVSVEEAGPLRVTIRAEGWYVKDGAKSAKASPTLPSEALCKHVTRITAYQGKPFVSVKHDVTITFDTHKVRLRNIGIGQRIEGASAAAFGLDGKAVAIAPLPPSVRLYQPSSEVAVIEKDQEEVRSGRRGDGWCRLSAPGAGVTLCVTDFWQLFPKEVEIAGGTLWLHLWPKHGRAYTRVDPNALGEIYKLWWCHTGAELNFAMPTDAYETLKKASSHLYQEDGRVANAQGVSFENNFLLVFDAGAAALEEAPSYNQVCQLSPHAWADPAWVCDSMVFGWMTPRNEEKFPNVERFFECALWSRVAAQEYARDYGQFNYADIHGDNSFFADGRWGLDRVWNQGHNGSPRMPWYLYARSGDPRFLQLARRQTRHVMNVDITHYVTPNYDLFQGFERGKGHWGLIHTKGAMFHNKGFAHWGGETALAAHHINYDHIIWDYYATGNLRAREVFREWQGAITAHGIGKGMGAGREATQPIAELLELYKASFDPRVLLTLNTCAVYIGGRGPFGKQHILNFAPFLERYLPFTGSQVYRDRAREWVGDVMGSGSVPPPNTGLEMYHEAGSGSAPPPNIAAAMYYETGDVKYLHAALPRVFFASLRWAPGPIVISDKTRLSTYYRVSYDIQYSQPFLRALADAGIALDLGPRDRQRIPRNAVVCIRKDEDADLVLNLTYETAGSPIEVQVARPDGAAALTLTLPPLPEGTAVSATPVTATVPRGGGVGMYRMTHRFPPGAYRPPPKGAPAADPKVRGYDADSFSVYVPLTSRPTVCVIPADTTEPPSPAGGKALPKPPKGAIPIPGSPFVGSQLWYFQVPPGQTTLEFNVQSTDYECGIQVSTADGKTVLAQVGPAVPQGRVEVSVTPGETYRLLHTAGHHKNVICPVGQPLVLARTPGEWFWPLTGAGK